MHKHFSTESTQTDHQVVEWLEHTLGKALALQASDLHLEPQEGQLRVRCRVDGLLQDLPSPPSLWRERLVSRIKVLSRLDIAEKRAPQDGRMKFKLGAQAVDLRISTLPTLHGEKIVIRILNLQAAHLQLDALGLSAHESERLVQALQRPNGMVLITGPTGSGKTVTLYSCLSRLNTPQVNISTVEDPSEILLPGANQVNVHERAGLSFASALRSLLRQDPDIVMVGEIRDLETADIAIKAAQTGHLVLSTLHTNDAPSTLTRLRHMGVAPFNIASSVCLITAQRLVRRLCPLCKAPAAHAPGFRAVGCAACHNGFKGRVGIHQVMPISEAMQRMILRDADAMQLSEQATREGIGSLRDSGLAHVHAGDTTLEEVLAATHEHP